MNEKIEVRIEGVKRAGKFTLIELLVVIAIIAILAAMLMPALGRARTAAHRIASVSNVRQISMALFFYADDYRGSMPFATRIHPATGEDSYALTWSLQLTELDYVAAGAADDPNSVFWGPATAGDVYMDDGEHLRHAHPGYGLNSGVTGSEEIYKEPGYRVPIPAPDTIQKAGRSQPLILGHGSAPPPSIMALVIEGGKVSDSGSIGRSYGKPTIAPKLYDDTPIHSSPILINYGGGIVRSYADGRAHARADNATSLTAYDYDPDKLGWDVDSNYGRETQGHRAGWWTHYHRLFGRSATPYFTWWSTEQYNDSLLW